MKFDRTPSYHKRNLIQKNQNKENVIHIDVLHPQMIRTCFDPDFKERNQIEGRT